MNVIRCLVYIGLSGLLLPSGGLAKQQKHLAPVQEAVPIHRAVHRVKPKETVYSIARRHQIPFQHLAKQNRLSPPYTLQIGQVLQIPVSSIPINVQPKQAMHKRHQPAHKKTGHRVKVIPVQMQGSPKKLVSQKIVVAKQRPIYPPPTQALRWAWPTQGQIITGFSKEKHQKGIDIAGQNKQPIRAAADGRVAYAGSGLPGYGKLLIIKHSGHYLSAYAHNHELLVQEGMAVKVGQVIAKMGKRGVHKTLLHFEIRRAGMPVDPLKYLPEKGLSKTSKLG